MTPLLLLCTGKAQGQLPTNSGLARGLVIRNVVSFIAESIGLTAVCVYCINQYVSLRV